MAVKEINELYDIIWDYMEINDVPVLEALGLMEVVKAELLEQLLDNNND